MEWGLITESENCNEQEPTVVLKYKHKRTVLNKLITTNGQD